MSRRTASNAYTEDTFSTMRIQIWRKRSTLLTYVLILCLAVFCFSLWFTANSFPDYSVLKQPGYTDYDELRERRKNGSFDNIPLKYLLNHTEFLKQPKSVCAAFPRMVILVQSACSNGELRNVIRSTWGKRAGILGIPVLFFLGQCPGEDDEIRKQEDIVRVNFVDSYYNNTIKTLSRYKWFLEKCSTAKYLIMSDDDAVIFVDLLYRFLRKGIGYSIVGPYYPAGTYAIRRKTSKWYVPKWVWPAEKYPEYIGGGTTIVNGIIVRDIYELSLETPFISIDDLLFNGIVAGMLGVHRKKDSRFPKKLTWSVGCGEHALIASQGFTPEEINDYWKQWTEKCGTVMSESSNRLSQSQIVS